MEIRHLRYFVAVADELHFGRAAQKLHIVQSALSRQIQDLERFLQIRLFIRDSRNVRLTDAGALFLEEAKTILSKSDKAVQLVRALGQGYSGRLRIGFVGMTGISGDLQTFLTLFRAHNPQLLVELIEAENQTQFQRLKAGELDIAIVSFPAADDDGLESFRFFSSRWLIGMSSDNPLGRQQTLHPTALQNENFILYGNQQTESAQISLLTTLIGSAPNIVNYANSTLSTLTLIAAGYGIALLPESLSHIGMPGMIYRPLSALTSTFDIHVCTPRLTTSPQIARFISLLKTFRQNTD